MKQSKFNFFITFVLFLLILTVPITYSATFVDTFDDPSFTSSNWTTYATGAQQTWSHTTINGTDSGYHASALGEDPVAAKLADSGAEYATADLVIETLVRLDSHPENYTAENMVGVAFPFVPQNPFYHAGIEQDYDRGTDTIFFSMGIDGEENFTEIPVDISFDTFYKLVVHMDSNMQISAWLFSLEDNLMGTLSMDNILFLQRGAIAIYGSPEVTFNNFKINDPNSIPLNRLTKTQISQLYVSIFGRASEGEGNTYWQTLELDMATTADVMLDTDAARNYFGANLNTNQAFIEHIYLNTLDKTISDDFDGISYWVNMLNAGISRGEAVAALVGAINDYGPDGPYYDPDDTATAAAYNQFTNRVEVSDYMADNIYAAPDDWETSTSFNHGMVVTDDPATAYAAKIVVNGFIGLDQDDQGMPTEPVKTENYDHCSHEPFFSSYVPDDYFVYQEIRHNRIITTIFEKSFPLTEAERFYLKNFVFETWDLYWNEFGGFPFDSYTVAFGEGYETCSAFGRGFDAAFTKTNWISHEIFHAWNGNAFRQENERMWFMEGVTTYYGDIRHQDEIGYQSILGSFVEYYLDYYVAQGRDRALGDMSQFDADYDHSFVAQKGAVLAYLLDKKLSETGHHLGEVVRLIYQRYGIDEKNGSPTNQEILSIFNEVSGEQFDSFFQQYVFGTELLPVERSNFVWIDH